MNIEWKVNFFNIYIYIYISLDKNWLTLVRMFTKMNIEWKVDFFKVDAMAFNKLISVSFLFVESRRQIFSWHRIKLLLCLSFTAFTREIYFKGYVHRNWSVSCGSGCTFVILWFTCKIITKNCCSNYLKLALGYQENSFEIISLLYSALAFFLGIIIVGYHPPFSTQWTSPSAIYSSSY